MTNISQDICLMLAKYNTRVLRIWINLFLVNLKISKCARERKSGGWDRGITHLRKRQT